MLTRDEDDDSPPVLGANQQGGIQAEYDRAYGWCMYSEHNVVPGYGARPVRTARPRKPATPTADKVSAPASASTWVAPTTASSGAAAGGSGSSGSGGAAATGWVQPAK
jgi:hypothetical protein